MDVGAAKLGQCLGLALDDRGGVREQLMSGDGKVILTGLVARARL